MNRLLDFSDVLIEPQFSHVRSRKDVDVSTDFLGMKLSFPILNSNMDTVASPALCRSLAEYGTVGTLHRFWNIEENVQAFKDSIVNGIKPIVSIGITENERFRMAALYEAGAEIFMLDVAHAANIAVVEFYNEAVKVFPSVKFIVGDFGTGAEIQEFLKRVERKPHAVKVGISVGSVCVTRYVTGVGTPALSCLLDCAPVADENDVQLILDGGVYTTGDVVKALVAGADVIVSGSLFAGTNESAGIILSGNQKEYRGSASLPSYQVQGKVAEWRAPEGKVVMVDTKGPVIDVLNTISGGLKSACSYVNAFNLIQLKANAKFVYK
jgi:GMP reductase